MKNEGGIVHVRVRIEKGELVEKEIVCPNCGGEARKFTGFDRDGAFYVFLACRECGEPLAEFRTNAEMEASLGEIWRTVHSYLVRSPKEFSGAFGPTLPMLSRVHPV
ncbi:MAG: hypothetical protein DMG40_02070 [Acidobacteria bacterium]|nr:MAG: hypothetical protein DMG40_02070 [Acidobacteriota bacterium]